MTKGELLVRQSGLAVAKRIVHRPELLAQIDITAFYNQKNILFTNTLDIYGYSDEVIITDVLIGKHNIIEELKEEELDRIREYVKENL